MIKYFRSPPRRARIDPTERGQPDPEPARVPPRRWAACGGPAAPHRGHDDPRRSGPRV